MKKPKILFTPRAIKFLLEAFGMTTDKKGYVIDAKTYRHVLDYEKNTFKPKDIVGFCKGEVFTSLWQMMDYAEEHEHAKPF